MRFNLVRIFRRTDWWLLAASVILAIIGLVLIYSLSWPEKNLFLKQASFLALALAAWCFAQFFDRHFWRNASIFLYIIIVLLLFFLLIFGVSTRGALGWLHFGPFSFQPAEFAKIASVLFLATTLEKLNFDLANIRHLLLVLLIIGLPTVLVFFQPDFGSAFIIASSGAIMVFYTGLDQKKFLVLLLAVMALVAVGWFGLLRDYQKTRILTFINPGADPQGAGYNVRQSIIAIGSGGLLGRGLGRGTQSQLNFLPAHETDFIFAAAAEELGFVGCLFLLALYFFILWRVWKHIKASEELFTNFLLLGIFTMFFFQSAINIGMNMGIFPVTGITMPLMSYGGSSLVATFFALGLVAND